MFLGVRVETRTCFPVRPAEMALQVNLVNLRTSLRRKAGNSEENGGRDLPDTKKEVSAAELEGILRQIRDVISARVVLDEAGTIQEIHVLAGTGRSPKHIVRDIESTFMAHFNLPIDHKKVSVAQLDWETGLAGAATWVKVVGVNVKVGGVRARCTVSLEVEGEVFTGEAEGAASAQNRLRLVAAAALNAVEVYLKGEVALALEGLKLLEVGGRTVAVVTVAAVTPVREENLAGASFITGDVAIGVAQAVLSALGPCLAGTR
ncbi:MAG: hypothetical protein PWQ41_1093 [Bacillota bacterium]|nr:hypothetical protein [Bacillota bacterium]